MKLVEIETVHGEGTCQIGVYRAASGQEYRVSFRNQTKIALPASNDHFFIVGALAAFLRHEPYEHLGPVSRSLFDNFLEAMSQWSEWWNHPLVDLHAEFEDTASAPQNDRKMGCLMSGGVDSLFTAKTQADKISAFVNLLHCKSDEAGSAFHPAHTDLNGLAADLDKSIYWVETNVMSEFSEIEDAWTTLSHGACMAAVGHFLSGELSGLYISASFAHDQMRPWGSHPKTDQLLSSETFQFTHLGENFNRFDKQREISASPEYLAYLSVCEHGPQSGEFINCSKCQKCLRAMITLDLLNIDRSAAPTFDWSDYRPEQLKSFLLQGHVNSSELLAYAEEIGRDDIAAVLRDVIAYSLKYRWIVKTEMFFRRRYGWLLKYKAFLKRIRFAVYAALRIRPRRQ